MLSVNIAGLRFRNPTMLASGILGISLDVFRRLYLAGAGAIVSKSISIGPIEGYRNPTVVSLGSDSYLNAVGLANPGADAFSKEITPNKDIPIIVSLVGSSDQEFPVMINKFDNLNVLAYEVNLSCPHVARMGMEVGDDPEMVNRIVRTIKRFTRKPVIIKVGVGSADVVEIAQVASDAGADAITAINTIRAMTINADTTMPVLSNIVGGLSGRAIKPVGIRCVYEISKKDMPVIGCGGVSSWEDAVEFMLAGATAVQIGSAIGNRWIGVFADVTSGIKKYLEKKGMKNAMEIVGLAHKH